MATITRENIAPLNDKLIVNISKEDYQPAFEKSIKDYAKKASIPGFRKGMVPSGLVKKMYGQGVLDEEIGKLVDSELNKYIKDNHLEILAQPIPLDNERPNLDINNPTDFSLNFEIGIQPAINVDPKGINVKRYQIEITDKMVDEEIERLVSRFGNYTTPETLENENTIISADVALTEGENKGDTAVNLKDISKTQQKAFIGKKVGDAITVQLDKAFKGDILSRVLSDLKLDKESKEDGKKEATLTITKLGLLENAALNEDLFKKVYPDKELHTEEEFRNALKEDLTAYFESKADEQIQDQIYHHLVDHVQLEMPEAFLKRWMVLSGENKKSEVEADEEYPAFVKQLQWALISSKLSVENEINVEADEYRAYGRHKIMGYLNGQMPINGDEPWLNEYVDKMMADRAFVEEAHGQIRISKLFDKLVKQVSAKDEPITEEAFSELLKNHNHDHEHDHQH